MGDNYRATGHVRSLHLHDECCELSHATRREVFALLRSRMPELDPNMYIAAVNMTVGQFCTHHLLSKKRRDAPGT